MGPCAHGDFFLTLEGRGFVSSFFPTFFAEDALPLPGAVALDLPIEPRRPAPLPRPLVALPRPLVAPPIPDPPKPAPGVADCRAPQRTSGTKLVLDTEGD